MSSLIPVKRPIGVTAIAILMILSGLAGLASGGFLISVALPYVGEEELAQLMGAMGSIALIIGLASLLLAGGLLKRKAWARTGTMVINIVSMVQWIGQLSQTGPTVETIAQLVVSIVIVIIVVVYLSKPHVKAYFGIPISVVQPTAMYPPSPPSYPPPPAQTQQPYVSPPPPPPPAPQVQPPGGGMMFCTNCGARISSSAKFCPRCGAPTS